MDKGPALNCSDCGRIFYGGKGYIEGAKNLCYECLVPKVESLSKSQHEALGETQQGLVAMILKMGGLQASGGKEFWITMMKVNAGELGKDALENITDFSADAQGIDRDYERLSVKGLEEMLENNFTETIRIFKELVAKFPDEGAPRIRLCNALRRSDKLYGDEHIGMLNKAERLITSKTSKYPMDKFDGMRDLYFLRACCYAQKGDADNNNYSIAEGELKKAFKLDPEYKDARELERHIRECQSKAVRVDSQNQDTGSVSNYCPKCNARYNLAKKFCGKCGVPLVTGTATPVAQEAPPQEVTYVSQPDTHAPAPSAKTNGIAKWFLGVVAAALCLGAIVIYFNRRDVPVSQPSAKPQAPPAYVLPVNKINTDSDNSQKNLGSLKQYRNMYEPSEINYAQKYPTEFDMLYALLKETFEKKELEDAINRKASQLDEMHLDKIRFFAAPNSVAQQKQQHIDYVPKLVNDDTLKEGLRFFDEYKDTIMNAYSKYKVTPQDIIAVINWESKFGKYKGEYSVYKVFVGNLFHISEMEKQFYDEGGYDKKDIIPRDKALNRIEKLKKRAAVNLAALLKLSIKKNFNPYEIKGSWAGAIGIPQFMPPSMIYAADGDGDAEIDLNNMHDAIFSVASFLNQHSYTAKGSKHALTKYNPEEMYVRGVSLYSSLIMEKGLSY